MTDTSQSFFAQLGIAPEKFVSLSAEAQSRLLAEHHDSLRFHASTVYRHGGGINLSQTADFVSGLTAAHN